MTTDKRHAMLAAALLLLLAGAATWSTAWAFDRRDAARQAAEDVATCRRHAHQIETLRRKPAVASAEAMGTLELGRHIDDASRRADLDTSSLDGVFPQSPRRIGSSSYLETPTTLVLRRVTLRQATLFLYYLTDGSGMTVHDLRLRMPRNKADRDAWDAEATLTGLVYAPPPKKEGQP